MLAVGFIVCVFTVTAFTATKDSSQFLRASKVIDKVLHELDIAEKGGGRKTQSGKRKARGRK